MATDGVAVIGPFSSEYTSVVPDVDVVLMVVVVEVEPPKMENWNCEEDTTESEVTVVMVEVCVFGVGGGSCAALGGSSVKIRHEDCITKYMKISIQKKTRSI